MCCQMGIRASKHLAVRLVILVLLLAACRSRQAANMPNLTPSPPSAESMPTSDPYQEQRARMVQDDIRGRGISNSAVLEAMGTVPRHAFVPEEYLAQAYDDHPLPIGHGQTISQPYIVAEMTEALQVNPGDRVLEIGTGSGYQAAILAQMGVEVYTVEIIQQLAERAEKALTELGYTNVHVLTADGYFGWEEYAPYDGIIVTCAPDHLPQPLLGQLKEDSGRLVIPIGPVGDIQTLWLFEKNGTDLKTTNLGGVMFVPLTRQTP
jgi:protein-L-isoaspartate(D-aspartate) O-methyltransferase